MSSEREEKKKDQTVFSFTQLIAILEDIHLWMFWGARGAIRAASLSASGLQPVL